MAETYQFALPLVAASQAQKHVTVNEALARLDAVAQLRVVSSTISAPPPMPQDGAAYLVPAGATADWAGQTGGLALAANGGWEFISPRAGWKLWDESTGEWQMFDGQQWVAGAEVIGATGAASVSRIVEISHTLAGGASSTVAAAIPALTSVTGVTARVTSVLEGTAATWRLGVPGSDDRYGNSLGKALNSYCIGLSGAPVAYYADTDIVISGEGGNLSGGAVTIAVHLKGIQPPRAI
ncbi:DUF2793 domain-containing protein [Algicella marina]|uniref:DUF2793 domain-containing protein n=1 Tax=Algicella marina TaxID=2683284 RepID=A0A6P1SYX1_9RHOB|nr:DUF2793 domain-containing protein [Algicella marina]QHQ34563.1 DUF2793 domain-containing protein [Algicella marina]